jgi:hypothetical protein
MRLRPRIEVSFRKLHHNIITVAIRGSITYQQRNPLTLAVCTCVSRSIGAPQQLLLLCSLSTPTMLRTTVTRALPRSSAVFARPAACVYSQQRAASTHAISNPTLANIEKRWEAMPPQEQADLWMALRDRMKVDWSEMTLQEKKAGMIP